MRVKGEGREEGKLKGREGWEGKVKEGRGREGGGNLWGIQEKLSGIGKG